MTIVLATNNQHKRAELTDVLVRELGESIEIRTLAEVGIEIDETGTTLEENALIKARAIFQLTHQPTVADDTGLEVAALGGAPGVYSARYAGEKASYADNVAKLLEAMEGKQNRNARFRTVIAYIDADGKDQTFSGEILGQITTEPHGTKGFGYDPIFAPNSDDKLSRTFAEMSSDEKNRISHRARALQKLAEYLRSVRESETR